jgi:predicted O-methyltransferase YrrM
MPYSFPQSTPCSRAPIPHQVLDQHMSVLEGSLGILPRRILVDDERHDEARRILEDAGLSHELRPLPRGEEPETTDDAVLGGRLRLRQQRRGHRIGHDAILLAASTGARSGDHVVDLGAGVGAAGLALAMRIPDATVTLVEIDPVIAALATENIERNGLGERARVVVLDVTAPSEAFAAATLGPGSADRVMMNPPFNDPARQNASPDAQRRTAHVAEPNLLSDWIAAAVLAFTFRRHVDHDLARRRSVRSSRGASAALAQSQSFPCMAAPGSPQSVQLYVQARQAAHRCIASRSCAQRRFRPSYCGSRTRCASRGDACLGRGLVRAAGNIS